MSRIPKADERRTEQLEKRTLPYFLKNSIDSVTIVLKKGRDCAHKEIERMRLQLDNKDVYIHLVLLSMTNNGSRIVWLLQVLYFLVRQLDVHRLCYSQNSATENARSAERTEQDILIVSFNFSTEDVPTMGAATTDMYAQIGYFLESNNPPSLDKIQASATWAILIFLFFAISSTRSIMLLVASVSYLEIYLQQS